MGLPEALVGAYRALDIRVSSAGAALQQACDFPEPPSPALAGLPLLSSPAAPLLLVAAYLVIAVGGAAAIRALGLQPREKDPALLRAYVLGHNLLLFALSAFLTVAIPLEAARLGYTVWGNAYNPKEARMAWLIYLFYVSKYIEFGDTFIMVLRRSVRQVSFLHVYHHATISLIWWLITYYAPGGDGYFSAGLNSLVHVAMYGYYFLAALLGRNTKLRAKYLFWGRYLTQMQMLQFVLMMLQSIYLLSAGSQYPNCMAKLLLVYMWTLLGLFAHFYIMKYISPQKDRAGAPAPAKRKLA